ncbi:hypothetical protein QJS04_geneDACA002074 [Acorus gramineus]|uniref:Uncharacterized protein n=1 Tax=Acorus gramineus TaxID=55184 RepID=A0AAV9AA54_ACOGR|nr:hypothetical protein QJS04_geneDACA002074 [Acorus gramineus]
MQSAMSAPLETSMTWLRRELGLSRVTKMGGLGLFLDPGGRPRARREEGLEAAPLTGSTTAPSLWLSGLSEEELSLSATLEVGSGSCLAEEGSDWPGRPRWPVHHRFASLGCNSNYLKNQLWFSQKKNSNIYEKRKLSMVYIHSSFRET